MYAFVSLYCSGLIILEKNIVKATLSVMACDLYKLKFCVQRLRIMEYPFQPQTMSLVSFIDSVISILFPLSFKTGSYIVVLVGLESAAILPQPLEC